MESSMQTETGLLILLFLILAAGMTMAFIAGLWIGRRQRLTAGDEEREGLKELRGAEEEAQPDFREREQEQELDSAKGEHHQRRHQKGERVIANKKAVGSPCSGEVEFFCEGSRRGAVIHPAQGMVYAPAAGKITRMYPMGNAFLLRTDFGAELLLKVGSGQDELFSTCYRPRVVQNEIVHKGKLLLEFDLEGLRAEGEDTAVSVSVEAAADREVLATGRKQVKTGEELLWIKEQEADVH